MTEINLGPVEQFPSRQFKLLKQNDEEIGIMRLGNGKFVAIENRCPHRGAPVCRGRVVGTFLPSEPGQINYGLDEKLLKCPWHGYEFDLETGSCVFTQSKLKLRMYSVEQRGTDVFLTLE